MTVSDVDLPSKPWSKYIVTGHSLHPLYRACFAGDLLPHESQTSHFDDCLPRCLGGFVSFLSCAMFYTRLLNMGLILNITRFAECRHNTTCFVISTIRSVVVT